MKPRPFSGSWPNFLCRLFVVVILLQDISAQPVSNQRILPSLADDRHLPSAHLERRPPPLRGLPQSSPPEHNCLEKVSEKSKNLHPVFLPFTVPVPWPTPFNGTDFAPVPFPIRPHKTTPVEISQDSDPIFILSPQFEFVPLYYNSPVLKPTSEPPPSVKVTAIEKHTPNSTVQQKSAPKPQRRPAPKPQSTSKPQLKSAPRPQPENVPPPTKSSPSKPVRPSSPRQQLKPVKLLPSKSQPKPSDPLREHPPTSKNFVPPPKHTWTPPPENVPEYIPPSPSNLHTRSSESHNNYDYVTYEPQYYTVSDNGITYNPEIFTYAPGSEFRYDPYRNGRYDPAYYDQSAYITYGPDIITYTEPTPDEDGYVTYGPDIVTYTEVPVTTYPKRPYQAKPPRPSPATEQPTYVAYGPDYVTYSDPTVYESGYIAEGPNTVTYIDDAPVPSPVRPTRPSQSSSQPSYVTYDPETVTIIDPITNDDKYISYGPNVAVHTDDAPVPPFQKRPTPAKSSRPLSRPPPPDQRPYVTYGPDRVIITEPTPREDGYVTYESGVASQTEDAPVPHRQKQPTPAKSPRPSSRLPPPDQPPYVTYGPDRVIITEPTPREDGYVTYESGGASQTEGAPVPHRQKQPTPAKSPRPSSRLPPPDQPPYVTYGPDTVIITEPTPREDGYVTYESGVASHTEDAPVPHRQKQPTPAKSPRPSSRLPPPDQPPYITYGPDRVIITEPTPREDGYVTYESDVATQKEDAPIPSPQMRPTSGKPQRPLKQPSASRTSPQTPTIGSRSSAFPVPREPEENEGGNAYYAPSYYTVVEEPNGKKAVIYEPKVMPIHKNEPHLEPPGEDPNLQYYESEPEYETSFEEDPGYITYYEEPQYDTVYESADEPQENSPRPPSSSAKIS